MRASGWLLSAAAPMRLWGLCFLILMLGWSCTSPVQPQWFLAHHSPAQGAQEPAPETGPQDEGDACPVADTEVDPALCEDLPDDYGFSPEHPLEWGIFAIGGNERIVPFFDRLLCESGDGAFAKRVGSRQVRRPSSSPPSVLGRGRKGGETIDLWRVECGKETTTIYANINRCGSHCPPKGFSLRSVAGHRAYQRALTLEREENLKEAVLAVEEAISLDPSVVAFRRTRGAYYIRLGRLEDLVRSTEEDVQAIPGHTDLLSYHVAALYRNSRWEEADTAANELLDLIDGTEDRNLPHILCRKGYISEVLGRAEEGLDFRMRSCEMGFDCCPEEESDDAP